MRRIIFFSIYLLSACSFAGKPEAQLYCAEYFYGYIVDNKLFTGLPSDSHLAALERCLSDELIQGLGYVQKAQSEFIQINGSSMKPPWIDGNLFGSMYEGFHSYSFGKKVVNGDLLAVPVYLIHQDEKEDTEWLDILVLKKEGNSWKVHDIKYCGTWAFRLAGTLLGNLQS